MNDNVKTIDELIKYLNSKGIETKEDDRQDLINYGYFHGFKGYRFYKDKNHQLPIKQFKEIKAIIFYDQKLKALIYDKIMFIEVALKNICLTVLLENLKSDDVNVLFEKGINSYKNCPKFFSEKKKEKIQETFLSLKTNIYTIIFNEYKKKNSVITHYYQIGQSYIPLYSIFEVLTLGSFGLLYKSLTYELRNEISIKLNLNKSLDSNREVLGDYIYLFKDLRNSIAHNKVIYDCRFKDKEITFQMKECLSNSLNYPYINFKDIFDYIALISYFLKILNIDKSAIKDFIDTFIKYVDDFKSTVSSEIVEIIFNKNHVDKIVALKKLIDF